MLYRFPLTYRSIIGYNSLFLHSPYLEDEQHQRQETIHQWGLEGGGGGGGGGGGLCGGWLLVLDKAATTNDESGVLEPSGITLCNTYYTQYSLTTQI